jgi:hypothetical protein
LVNDFDYIPTSSNYSTPPQSRLSPQFHTSPQSQSLLRSSKVTPVRNPLIPRVFDTTEVSEFLSPGNSSRNLSFDNSLLTTSQKDNISPIPLNSSTLEESDHELNHSQVFFCLNLTFYFRILQRKN